MESCSEIFKIGNLVKRSKPNSIFYAQRGAGLGWAMPFSLGISMAKNEPVLCFVGDGGSIYAIQSIYSGFKYKLPVIYVCFENRCYHILKELAMFQNSKYKSHFVGLDFDEAELDLVKIVEGFGGTAYRASSYEDIKKIILANLKTQIPVWISVPTMAKLNTMFDKY